MSMSDITIARQNNIINGFVSVNENVIQQTMMSVQTALFTIPGIILKQLTTRRGQYFIETEPGVVTCCGNIPADEITREYIPPVQQSCLPCVDIYPPIMDIQFYGKFTEKNARAFLPPGMCNCPIPVITDTIYQLTTVANCIWQNAYGNSGELKIVLEWNSELCLWQLIIYCLGDSGYYKVWQGVNYGTTPNTAEYVPSGDYCGNAYISSAFVTGVSLPA